mmetsp:Transcript_25698/g.40521  ORF Transcript_25698/g.40521 Transcript_25698/m.40521 type:complete len:236 (-) Transcript_25698:338-1045(-)
MRHAAIHDHRCLCPCAHGPDRGHQLGDHAARDGPVRLQPCHLVQLDLAQELLVLVQHAGHVREQQQPGGAQRARDRAGGGVGIDVQRLPLRGDAHGGDHRDQPRRDHVLDQLYIDRNWLSNKTQVKGRAEAGAGVGDHLLQLLGQDQVVVLAGEPQRPPARAFDTGYNILIYGPRKHHLSNPNCILISDPQPLNKCTFNVQFFQHLGNLGATTMHNHWIHSTLLQEHNILREVVS